MKKYKSFMLGGLACIAILIGLLYSAFSNNAMDKIANTDKIIVYLSKNANGSRPTKTITDPNEIQALLDVFQTAVIGEEVAAPDMAAPNLSEYILYYGDERLNSFVFLGDDCYTAMVQPKFFSVTYEGATPYELYSSSKSPETLSSSLSD